MKKSILLSVLAALCLSGSVKGQSASGGLQTGDQVPELILTNVVNHSAKTLKLSDYRGKLLVLDFWASWCSSCIENLPRIEGLAAKYSGRFAVLGVDDDPNDKVTSFFRTKSHNGKPYHFTTTYGSTPLRKWFPHRAIPHCVWIDKNGKVAAITGAAEVNEQNVRAMLDNIPLTVTTKIDIDNTQPLFLNQWFTPDSLQHYSIFIKGSYPGTGSSSPVRVRGGDTVGQGFTNTSLLNMYEVLGHRQLRKYGQYIGQKAILETPDSARLRYEDHQVRYIQSNPSPYAHNADFVVPRFKRDSVFLLMIMELNRYSGYRAGFEKRRTAVYALQKIDPGKEFKTSGGAERPLMFNGGTAVAVNQRIRLITARLQALPEINSLIVDETDIKSNIDLRFSGKTDRATIFRELEDQGLRLVKKDIMLTTLVIKGHAIP